MRNAATRRLSRIIMEVEEILSMGIDASWEERSYHIYSLEVRRPIETTDQKNVVDGAFASDPTERLD